MLINPKNYPLISVVMNCYNGENYISNSVKSILMQTYKNFEIIFWDNQSKDKSASIYKSFKDKRLKYYYAKKHTSLYEARNLAIKKTKGKFIAFLDVDDLWIKDKLNLQVKKFTDKKIGLVYSNYYILNQITGRKKIFSKKKLPEGLIFQELLKEYFVGICTVIMRKDIFKKNKEMFNKDYNIIGDFDLFTRISKKIHFASIDLPLSIYRVHNKSLSRKNYDTLINEFKHWIKNQRIFNNNSLNFIKEKIIYMEVLQSILNETNFILCMKKIIKINSFKMKIKLFIFLLVPNFILIKLKENF
jgi:glycosyltransferase involved in cell wall biosynthesis